MVSIMQGYMQDAKSSRDKKLLAAIEAGVKTVILPAENEQDVRYLPDYMRDRVAICYVSHIQEVLELALVEGKATT